LSQAADQAAACRCGRPKCNCAKWEEIFERKFADPTYYTTPRGYGHQSPLAGAAAVGPDLKDLSRVGREFSSDTDFFRRTITQFASYCKDRRAARPRP